ncbi:gephyrin-like molybdotransferase Glp [Desulfosarcina ovata]|uniref:Molybdopterin molybdenumtransferase n=1 Tax=Desulfosarcina ovata subsp. ovata TaxID=2752305 RepID=A0A5K8AJV1_9BACT|nr:gephyrin-like molybdotransferase Glp [Desulfosarcina ovata]BBO92985.1 molybdopterin molybdenumtransferase [Desulfosarcina ovata subsp. ovata]
METSLVLKNGLAGGGVSGRSTTWAPDGPEPLSWGLKEALRLVLETIRPLPAEEVSLVESVGRMAAADLFSLVNSPGMDSSRKDGFAVASGDIAGATESDPVQLPVSGTLAAGDKSDIPLCPGTTVRVLTGARIPAGVDAVVAEEYVVRKGNTILFGSPIRPGKNVLLRGSDISMEHRIVGAGQLISPLVAGLLAAGGYSTVPVRKTPTVGIVGTGDEIVKPGTPLKDGQLYASNIVTLAGWCKKYAMPSRMTTVKDDYDALYDTLKALSEETDALITSGGAWMSDRDFVAQAFDELGWRKLFHRIRMGPGKAVGFGMLGNKPVFVLAGGPPSNLMGFLQIALPGLQALCGHADPGLPTITARLAQDIKDGKKDWSDFYYGKLEAGDDLPLFHPMKKRIRLAGIAETTAVARVPEGEETLLAGSVISVQRIE